MSEHKWCLWQWQSGSWSANTRILADLYLTSYTRSSSTQTFATIKMILTKNTGSDYQSFIFHLHTQPYDVIIFFMRFFLAIGIIPSFEYYKFTNMRPPFTYASMIRWVSTAELNILYITFSFPVSHTKTVFYTRRYWSPQRSSLLWTKYITGLPACFSTFVTTLSHGRYEMHCLYCKPIIFVIPWLTAHKPILKATASDL